MASPNVGFFTAVNQTPGNNFYQFNHNQNTGTGGMVCFHITMANSVTPSTATYGGQSMTRLYTVNRGSLGQRMAFYYLLNPPTGFNTLRVNFSGSQWNPVSIYARSFTGATGIGSYAATGGQTTPNTQTLPVSQDSLILITSCSVNQILTQQIPTGNNRPFTTHNTNRQVATGAISASGHNAGTISLRATGTFGTLSLDRVEIGGVAASVSRRTIIVT